jgi:hypothetical protein
MDGQIITTGRRAYEPPSVRVLGSVGELTLITDKKYGSSDGYAFLGVSITNASS